MAISVISEAGITGRFRVVPEGMECEARIVRRSPAGEILEAWSVWRPATAADHELAHYQARA